MSETTDAPGRRRRVHVAIEALNELLRGHAEPSRWTDAPADLIILSVLPEESAPPGVIGFIVWSQAFESIEPAGQWDEPLLVEFEYQT